MPDMLKIYMRSPMARPADVITFAREPGWADHQFPCAYEAAADRWVVDVPTDGLPDGFECKFLRAGVFQLANGPAGNRKVTAADYARGVVEILDVEFTINDKSLEQELFGTSWNPDDRWDYIVVGSGMGGGAVAHALAADDRLQGRRVLVLEAGGLIFPTHTGNMPRRHDTGDVSKSVWQMWDSFKRQDYTPIKVVDGVAVEDRMHNTINITTSRSFGGRSLFWGCTAPRLSAGELQRWPAGLRNDLNAWYPKAEAMLTVEPAPNSAYQNRVLALLQGLHPGAVHVAAPMAVEYAAAIPAVVPGGLFSTAAMLFEDQRQKPPRLVVHLRERVVGFDFDGNRVTAVHTQFETEVPGREQSHTYQLAKGGTVVLAAGSVDTPALALRTGIAKDLLVGKGLTDHPVLFSHFHLPLDTEFAPIGPVDVASSKTLSRFDGYNVLLELGANLNQARFASEFERNRVLADERSKGNFCEVVFLLDSDLVDANSVTVDGDVMTLTMATCPIPAGLLDTMTDQATELVTKLGGAGPIVLQPSSMGSVAHEVGTMRTGDDGDKRAVVDTDLKVKGYENLYGCDLSVFPTSPASNPSLTLAALALRLADHLL